jgi:hypothetical protein
MYGTVKGFGPFPALVTPWMPNGTLTSYLDREGVTLTSMGRLHIVSIIYDPIKIPLQNLTIFSQVKQIAEGLEYRK